ncbi:MAG: hypothetical protein OXJ56_21270 [Rhodospirillaceae bacterium]|nr:hypothetical protein [Rhodospirillaceae bacterium]
MTRRIYINRRRFLAGSAGAMGAAYFGRSPLEAMAQETSPADQEWDAGLVRHILPTVSDSRILLKVSFDRPLSEAPTLRIGTSAFSGKMSDATGEYWQFHAGQLQPGRPYTLALQDSAGQSLCEPWPLATFPAPEANPERVRILFFTCAGGTSGTYEGIGQREAFLPASIRNRLLRRALSFQPDAAVANGDHIYWDLHTWQGENAGQLSEAGRVSNFDFSASALGGSNESAIKAAAGPQIVPVYGCDFRSTPVFFLQDDHDHWENDAVTDDFASYPIQWFQLQLARATQQLYYPEFLPDPRRPAGLPWSSAGDRGDVSESFGTIRFGQLAEVLLYDVRRTMNLAGPNAVFVDHQVERWLTDRTRSTEVRHLVHTPSNPFGWSAGKWGEWYPDILDPESGTLTTSIDKPYWQEGWLRQHDRLAAALSAQTKRVPLVISGDLHAIGTGRFSRAGALDLQSNPVTAVLSGPISTSEFGFPSVVRGIRATPSAHLDLEEMVPPVEDHGFTLIDFLQDRIVLRQFAWDVDREPLDAIDRLEPFYTTELEPVATEA